uniref:Uncharacterized protein n=1 Tax=Ascaris lumbricoides TaxID=6252 RepID=A0A0M3HTQ9_ASCLU
MRFYGADAATTPNWLDETFPHKTTANVLFECSLTKFRYATGSTTRGRYALLKDGLITFFMCNSNRLRGHLNDRRPQIPHLNRPLDDTPTRTMNDRCSTVYRDDHVNQTATRRSNWSIMPQYIHFTVDHPKTIRIGNCSRKCASGRDQPSLTEVYTVVKQ